MGGGNNLIGMKKLCEKPFAFPLTLIFDSSFRDEIFPKVWTMSNLVPVHKEKSKSLIKITLSLVFFLCLMKPAIIYTIYKLIS